MESPIKLHRVAERVFRVPRFRDGATRRHLLESRVPIVARPAHSTHADGTRGRPPVRRVFAREQRICDRAGERGPDAIPEMRSGRVD